MQYLIGIDIGTSATKSVLYDPEGNVIAEKSVSYPMYQPENGWAEQDADDWWEATKSTVRTVLENSGVKATRKMVKGHSLIFYQFWQF